MPSGTLNIGIFGALGRMGVALCELAPGQGAQVVECIETPSHSGKKHPVCGVAIDGAAHGKADVYLDFSAASAATANVRAARQFGKPIVIGTTALTDEDIAAISEASREVAVVRDSNFSLGVAVLRELVRGASVLAEHGFDVEIIEAHHRNKLDSPSGTAISLLDCLPKREVVNGRSGNAKRGDEIGIHAVRGGGIVGEHQVMFISSTEMIELRHFNLSRNALASGALHAAAFAAAAPPGLYRMADVWAALKNEKPEP